MAAAGAAARRELMLSYRLCGGVELQHHRAMAHAFRPHFHEGFQIFALTEGEVRLRVEEAEHLLSPSALCAINPGQVHAAQADGWGWACRIYYVHPRVVGRLIGRRARFPSALIDDVALCRSLIDAHRAAEHCRSEIAERMVLGALRELFHTYACISDVPNEADVPDGIRRARSVLEQNFAADLPLDTLAGLAELSRFHFLRQFGRACGLTPRAYQAQLRLAHAKRRLLEGANAAEAAIESGFYDQSHLIRMLRSSSGLTPGVIGRARNARWVSSTLA